MATASAGGQPLSNLRSHLSITIMNNFTKITVLCLALLSLYDVFSTSEDTSKSTENEQDAFHEFDDPAYKYSEEAQNEHLEIRTPSAADSPSKSFVPPIDMPPISFKFCVSCGYRNAFEQYSQIINDKFPGIHIEGGNYSPGAFKSLLAQFIGFAKIGLIIMVVFERNPFTSFGMQTPSIYNWMLSNKLSACLLMFMFSNSIESMLMSTGAFEIYIGKEQIWSKLESGRVPSPAELIQAIESHLALNGANVGDFGSFTG